MITITKAINFSAAHWLNNPALSPEENRKIFGPDNDPARHGHNYRLEVTVAGEIDPHTQMVMNLIDLKQLLMTEIYDAVDHKDLTEDVDFLKGIIPTAENLVTVFWKRIEPKLPRGVKLEQIRLYETATGWVTCRADK